MLAYALQMFGRGKKFGVGADRLVVELYNILRERVLKFGSWMERKPMVLEGVEVGGKFKIVDIANLCELQICLSKSDSSVEVYKHGRGGLEKRHYIMRFCKKPQRSMYTKTALSWDAILFVNDFLFIYKPKRTTWFGMDKVSFVIM